MKANFLTFGDMSTVDIPAPRVALACPVSVAFVNDNHVSHAGSLARPDRSGAGRRLCAFGEYALDGGMGGSRKSFCKSVRCKKARKIRDPMRAFVA